MLYAGCQPHGNRIDEYGETSETFSAIESSETMDFRSTWQYNFTWISLDLAWLGPSHGFRLPNVDIYYRYRRTRSQSCSALPLDHWDFGHFPSPSAEYGLEAYVPHPGEPENPSKLTIAIYGLKGWIIGGRIRACSNRGSWLMGFVPKEQVEANLSRRRGTGNRCIYAIHYWPEFGIIIQPIA